MILFAKVVEAGSFSAAAASLGKTRAAVSKQTFTGPVVMLVVVVSIAALYPAIKAATLRPLDAIRHQ